MTIYTRIWHVRRSNVSTRNNVSRDLKDQISTFRWVFFLTCINKIIKLTSKYNDDVQIGVNCEHQTMPILYFIITSAIIQNQTEAYVHFGWIFFSFLNKGLLFSLGKNLNYTSRIKWKRIYSSYTFVIILAGSCTTCSLHYKILKMF